MPNFSFRCKISRFSFSGIKSFSVSQFLLIYSNECPFKVTGQSEVLQPQSGCFRDKCFLRKSGTSLCPYSTHMLLAWGVTQRTQTPGDTLDVLGCVTCSLVFVPKVYGSPMGLMSHVSTLPRKPKSTRQLFCGTNCWCLGNLNSAVQCHKEV